MPSMEKLKEVQARSGIFMAFYVVIHFACHFTLPFGLDFANSNLIFFRHLYQHTLFESLMLLSFCGHVYANVSLYIKRKNLAKNKKDGAELPNTSPERKAHQYAGYFLAFSLIGHVGATRIGPLYFLKEDASQYDYGFVAKANELLPGDFFVVYLVLFGMAGGWHMIYGVRSALATFRGKSVAGTPFPMALKVLAMMSHVGILFAALSLGGYLYPIGHTQEESELHDKLFTGMGMH